MISSRIALLVGLVGLAACRTGAARLAGHWVGQKATGVATEAQAAANRFAAEMTLDFHGDTIAVKTERAKQTGHYRVLRDEATTVVIVTDEDGAGDEQTFTLEGDSTLSWSALKDKTIVFKKQ